MSSSNPTTPADGNYPPLSNNNGGYYSGGAQGAPAINNPSIYSTSVTVGSLSGSSYTYGASSNSIDTLSANRAVCKMCPLDDGGIQLIFSETEDNQLVFAELAPEHSITSLDTLRIQVLIAACNTSGKVKPLTYIRKHNLEKHFKFSVT